MNETQQNTPHYPTSSQKPAKRPLINQRLRQALEEKRKLVWSYRGYTDGDSRSARYGYTLIALILTEHGHQK